jgi:hypothetical protein
MGDVITRIFEHFTRYLLFNLVQSLKLYEKDIFLGGDGDRAEISACKSISGLFDVPLFLNCGCVIGLLGELR